MELVTLRITDKLKNLPIKVLSVISYIIAVIFTAIGFYYMIALPNEFGGDVYTYTVSLAYAQTFFIIALIFFFLGFAFGYFSNKSPHDAKVEELELKTEETKETEVTNPQ